MHAPFPETLSAEWVPPVLFGREAESDYLDRRLGRPVAGEVPHAAVVGPRGSGSSVVVRAAAARWVRQAAPVERGRVVPVSVRWCHGTVGVASALLRAFDEGFGGRGFSVAEIMAGFLRRLQRDGRRVAIVLDDAGSAGPELRPILRALLAPGSFLPEGLGAPPRWAVLVAGTLPAPALQRELADSRFRAEERLTLAPYSAQELGELLADRARRALGSEPEAGWFGELLRRALDEGGGASRALQLLRDQFGPPASPDRGAAGRTGPEWESVEPRLLVALARATVAGPCELSALRDAERKLAQRDGVAPLAATTLWRRMIRLEQMGVLQREVRSGGPGGSRSLVHLRRPLPAVAEATERSTLRASVGLGGAAASPRLRWERLPAPPAFSVRSPA